MEKQGRRRRAVILVTAAMLGVMPFLVAAGSSRTAHQTMPACGDTVRASVTFTADLTGCGGDGLVAGASGITINLNGHTLGGSGGDTRGVGIGGFNSVTVENGTIQGFKRGVEVDTGNGARLLKLRVTGNADAGIYTAGPATISKDVVWGNGGTGIVVICCAVDKSTITNNVVNGNTGDGISVGASATGSVVSGNHVLSNGAIGIELQAAGSTVSNNVANANGSDGMDVSSGGVPPIKASHDVANDNTGLGINFGAADFDGGGNTAHGNGAAHQCENVVCS